MEVGRPTPASSAPHVGAAHAAHTPPPAPTPVSAPAPAAVGSLYTQTMALIERLYSIPGFDAYLFPEGVDNYVGNPVLLDPVAVLWSCFRLGSPFCHLYNQLQPRHPLPVPDVPTVGLPYGKSCKKAVYNFIVACKMELGLSDRDLFSISGLYKDDTNEFVQLVKTITLILTKIDERGLTPTPRKLPFTIATSATTDASRPTDNRTKLIAELLTTERAYTVDLEKLQHYQTLCRSSNSITRDMILRLFANLDDLLDFQRRFLLQMETCLSVPINEQRVGALFLQNEDAFSVYIPFCANYPAALELSVEKADLLMDVSPDMDPRMLQNYLIKPIQRVCKYPLLLQGLAKLSKDTPYAYMAELQAGIEAVKRAADRVNEEKRNEENRALKRMLVEKIEDWKGLNPREFGDLILSDHFPMMVGDSEHGYELFLFERILLCCKPMSKKSKKSKKTSGTTKPTEDAITSYLLKGNIYIERIDSIIDSSHPEQMVFQIKVFWRDETDLESFVLKCRNMEQVKLWFDRIESLLNIARMRRMSLSNNNLPPGAGNPINAQSFDNSSEIDSSFENSRRQSHDRYGRPSISSQGMVSSSSQRNSHEYAMMQQQQVQQQMMNRRSSPVPKRTSASNPNLQAGPPVTSTNGSRTSLSSSRNRSQSPNMDRNSSMINSSMINTRASMTDLSGTINEGGVQLTDANGSRMNSASRESVRIRSRSRGMSLSSNQHYTAIPPPGTVAPSQGPALLASPDAYTESHSRSIGSVSNILHHSTSGITTTAAVTSTSNGVSSMPPPSQQNNSASSHGSRSSSSAALVKVKAHYGSDVFVIAVPHHCGYADLLRRLEHKVSLCSSLPPTGKLKIRFRDDDGDYIAIYTDEDVDMAIETSKITGSVSLWIS